MHPCQGTGRVVFAAVTLVSLAVAPNYSAAHYEPPEWAYPSTPRDFKPDPDDGKPKRLAASTKAYPYVQLSLQEMIDIAAYGASKMP